MLETLKEMISSLPINDVTSEELFVNLEKIRAKYKQVGTRWSYTDELMCLEILNMNEDHFFFHHSSKILVIHMVKRKGNFCLVHGCMVCVHRKEMHSQHSLHYHEKLMYCIY